MTAVKENSGLFQKPRPPVVGQKDQSGQFRPRCWAAALSSWLKVTRDLSWSVDDLIKMFKQYLLPNDGLPFQNFADVAGNGAILMGYDIVVPESMTEEYLVPMLRRSHLYVIIAEGGISHAVVVHGISRRNGTPFIWGMDPMENSYTVGRLGDFVAFGQKFLVGYAKAALGPATHPIFG
ncbi:MAG: hypothetical protein R2747_10375 [Pyrinomonadaceae bacterium]